MPSLRDLACNEGCPRSEGIANQYTEGAHSRHRKAVNLRVCFVNSIRTMKVHVVTYAIANREIDVFASG